MKRREFIALLGSAAVVWPLAVRAQQPTMPIVGFISTQSADVFAKLLRAFRQGLGEVGYAEGHNMTIEYRWAEGHNERLPGHVADLISRRAKVIFASGNPAVLAAKAQTATTPIVFATAGDPVQLGFVSSFNRPGGNVTGVSFLSVEVGPKRLELLHECLPGASDFGVLVNPVNPTIAEPILRDLKAAALGFDLQLHIVHASTERDFDGVFATLVQRKVSGLVVSTDAFLSNRTEQLAALAVRHAMPTIFQTQDFALAGGLMSYGTDIADAHRLGGRYAGRILKGEKPGDLPVQQSTKIELIINLKTAKSLSLEVPPTLLARADEVIE